MAMIGDDTIDRIVMNLKGRIKNLIVERDANLVFSTLKLLHKVLELDPAKKILDFELVQNLVMNLDHTNTKIFNETADLLAHNAVLEDNNFLKVVFTSESMHRLLDMFPRINDPAKVNFCLTVIFEFTHDPKTAGTLMVKGGKNFYTALVGVIDQAHQPAERDQEGQTGHHEVSPPTLEVQLEVRSTGTLPRLERSGSLHQS